MNLYRATGTIGGLTMVSRIAGFARDMLLARILGPGMAADSFFVAFQLPNIFRRLFAEGAFSAAFVPLFSRKLGKDGELDAAERFSSEVVSVFLPILLLFTAIIELAMPAVIWLMASGFQDVPGKFELTIALSRITFPYLMLISMVALLTAILNSMSRFAAGASFPILLNIVLIAAILLGDQLRGSSGDDILIAYVLAGGVAVGGVVQLLWLWFWMRRSGFTLRLHRPRFTKDVKELGIIILPATFGAGVYQISQLVQLFFATQLPGGSVSHLNFADRLNQLPLGVIGIALGTAILPALSRHIGAGEKEQADRVQSNAIELAMLLTLPAAAALMICAPAFVSAFFLGGAFDAADVAITSQVLAALVAGLPAYVLIKVLTPAYFSRKDTKTPVYAAAIVLTFFITFNIVMIDRLGIVGIATATAIGAWFNVAILYTLLWKRGHYRMHAALIRRLMSQLLAAGAMTAALYFLIPYVAPWFGGGVIERVLSIGALVFVGMLVYFGAAALTGALDKSKLALLFKKKASQ
ncbi:murein biosynthesis integral membrane protein MurJ [Parasphingopyxis marina]|uniref:Probable lipid II flippase MurJ n=1 Tax=Parasphingopyxis marina TaxID=2761622 RepID=A0A842HU97_9SPHN|nr:murein biosynthesis integral membrane protein MurJ [Parasphingopyxis marina]MBC2777538.1 murein biosynthesis integral membrane protein MurJ [Parasphingopyxis marina]